MILSDLLRSDVYDDAGRRLGRVVDVRFELEGGTTPSQARILGIIVSPRTAGSYLGYERTGMSRPAVVDRLLRWIHRGSFLVPWADLRRLDSQEVRLRSGYRRLSSALPDAKG